MKYRMLDLLCCPQCSATLSIFPFEETEVEASVKGIGIHSPRCRYYCGVRRTFLASRNSSEDRPDCASCYGREVLEGILVCECGSLFPIIDKVPRFLEGKLASFPKFLEKNRKQVEKVLDARRTAGARGTYSIGEAFTSIHDSFSQEWDLFEYERDKTWGWDISTRKKIFLDEMGLGQPSLSGKLLLDAGCGNGILTSTLSEFGMEVIGLDVSESVVRAEQQKDKYANATSSLVHFVQGNLFTPPLRTGAFDLIYSSGVLHHCPNTRDTFFKLVPLVKNGGRVYIWVYGKRGPLVRAFFWHGRLLRRFVSLKSLYHYCRALSPLYKSASDVLSALKLYSFRKRTTREISLDLFDAFSPQYNHAHDLDEVTTWFAEHRFTNITKAGVSKHGLGVRGDRA